MKKNPQLTHGGMIHLPHPKIKDYYLWCYGSNGGGWEHVSVSLKKREGKKWKDVERCPTWEDMCFVKDYFWEKDEVVIQYHPAESDYISMHHYCLHLWKPIGVELLTPDPLMVGINLD